MGTKLRPTVALPSSTQESTCLAIIKTWLEKQPHLPEISDEDLLLFLHCCRYSVEQTKNVIDSHFTIRSNTDFFLDRNLSSKKCKECFDVVCFLKLEGRTPDGERVLYFRFIDNDVNRFDYIEVTRYTFALLDIFVRDDKRQPGYHVLYDLQGLSLGHVLKTSAHMPLVKKELGYIQDALPFVLMGVHIINASAIAEPIMAIVRPLLNSGILNLIKFYGPNDISKLYDFIPQKMLPKEYGGEGPSYMYHLEKAKELLYQNQAYITEKENQTVDESKRRNKSKYSNDIYGLDGSFKKLDLD